MYVYLGFVPVLIQFWETDFYTPQMLGDAALFDNSAAAVYKNSLP